MLLNSSFKKGSYITRRQVSVYELFKNCRTMSEVAKRLGVSKNTVYTMRRNVEYVIERAIRTLEVAQEIGIRLDEKRIGNLIDNKGKSQIESKSDLKSKVAT